MCEITAEESLEVFVCQAVNRGFQPSSLQQGALTPQQHSVMKQSTIKPLMCRVSPPAVQSCEEKTNKSVRFKVQPRHADLIRSC